MEQLAEGLARLGYALEPTEVARLLEQMHSDGFVKKSGFLASQIDWSAYQVDFRCDLLCEYRFFHPSDLTVVASQTTHQIDSGAFACSIHSLLTLFIS